MQFLHESGSSQVPGRPLFITGNVKSRMSSLSFSDKHFGFFAYVPGKPAQPVKRELLRHRDYKVDLESKLGKTIVITKTTPQSEMGG